MPWPAVVMLLIVMARLPRLLKRPLLWLIDKILFIKISIGGRKVSLFWVV